MSFQLRPLTPVLGAEVSGLDLDAPLPATTLDQVQQALDQYRVLFFRRQTLPPAAQRDFAARLGPLHRHPIYPHNADIPEIMVLDTALNDLRDNAVWHSDVSFLAAPAAIAVLYAEIVPAIGGDTLWSCQQAAYRALSPSLRRWLDGLQAIHCIDHSFPLERFGASPEQRVRRQAAVANHPPQRHPVVRRHPRTGEASLYVNEGFTTAIDELTAAESQTLLQFLFQHSRRPEFQLRWAWQAGDVAIWDNRNTVHYACDDYRPGHRRMRRATVLGEPPQAVLQAA